MIVIFLFDVANTVKTSKNIDPVGILLQFLLSLIWSIFESSVLIDFRFDHSLTNNQNSITRRDNYPAIF